MIATLAARHAIACMNRVAAEADTGFRSGSSRERPARPSGAAGQMIATPREAARDDRHRNRRPSAASSGTKGCRTAVPRTRRPEVTQDHGGT
ncbi:hypothetical protein [Burkholderia aenigmatica]|uniref:hypothetical protein n=1 Tax=Burkholderia aenigmatica TaxID=2015348 RepID=UPI0026525C6B|nr:hypothetical protein [Burkholderia aenigmatica]MDN7878797.1 hypothetical protein [Burkholderia aenigmatica]